MKAVHGPSCEIIDRLYRSIEGAAEVYELETGQRSEVRGQVHDGHV